MAITIDDFSKIWASTSPLTPYEFSESHYKEGWNFIGGTPPSRQMWDFLQKNNDEKLKYLLDNFNDYLPLAGGTMTGAITLADGGNPLSTAGGTMTGAIVGNPLTLTADDGNGNTKSFVANADGTLTWDNVSIPAGFLGSAPGSTATSFTLPKIGTYLVITGHNSTPGTNSIFIVRTGGSNPFKMAGGANVTMSNSGTQITVTSSIGAASVFYIYLGT